MFAALTASLLVAQTGAVGPPDAAPVERETTILVVTGAFGGANWLVSMQREAPWDSVTVAALDSPDAVVQSFSGLVFVVEPSTDRVRVFGGAGTEQRCLPVGQGTRPRDILGVARNKAYVTRADSAFLYRVDPQTGAGADVVDLSAVAGVDGIPDMERMASVGSRLFIQLRRLEDGLPTSGGAIAVVDLETETLIDVDPATPEIDAIELEGPSPRLRMHVDAGGAFMLVSAATDGDHLSLNGGIERVDLGSLSSAGFVLGEKHISAALGGFVMTEPAAGYFLFHTDIIQSNHLQTFTISEGHEPGPDIVSDLGLYLDALLFDPETDLIFMPSADAGMHVVDASAKEPITKEPIPLPGFPFDQTIGPIGRPFDLTGDDVVGFQDLLVLLAGWGDCPSPCPPTCLPDIAAGAGPGADCMVDFSDLLLLLANWGP